MRVYVCKGARGLRVALRAIVGEGDTRELAKAGWPLGSVVETLFALSRVGMFFAAHKMAANPTRFLHSVRGCRGLEFSPSCSLYTPFVHLFVRSFVSACCFAIPFHPSPVPSLLLANTISPPLLKPSTSINPHQPCHISLLFGYSPLSLYF